jgi:hypothetical protein
LPKYAKLSNGEWSIRFIACEISGLHGFPARQTGSFSIACATTDKAAAIAAHAAQGDWPRIRGTNFSTLSRRSLPAVAYSPTHAEISAAPMAIQEAASLMDVKAERQTKQEAHPIRPIASGAPHPRP